MKALLLAFLVVVPAIAQVESRQPRLPRGVTIEPVTPKAEHAPVEQPATPPPAPKPQPPNIPGKALLEEGNPREASASLLQQLRGTTDPEVIHAALPLATQALAQLNDFAQAEALIEEMAKAHPTSWRSLTAAAIALKGLPQHGQILDGKFQRGSQDKGTYAGCTERDRVRSLQLLLAARQHLPQDAPLDQREELLRLLLEQWTASVFELQKFTDLTQLPEPVTGYGSHRSYRSHSTHPVDAAGRPIFFSLLATFAAARNDGERLRWAFHDYGLLSGKHGLRAQVQWATLLSHTLSCGTLPTLDATAAKGPIMAFDRLTDYETSAQTASGPQRIALPKDQAFVALWSDALKHPDFTGEDRFETRQSLVRELLIRRQRTRAAAVLRAEIARQKSKDVKAELQIELDQITANWGRFEEIPAQPAGTPAKLSLTYRNATQIQFKAQRVDVAKLVADSIAFWKTKPKGDTDQSRGELSFIGQRLLSKEGKEFLIGEPIVFDETFNPPPGHEDHKVEITTPLSEAGAYLIEATFNKTHPTRCVLWLEGLTIVATDTEKGQHLFVCDAVTGAAVPKAKVQALGREERYIDAQRSYVIEDVSVACDDQGCASIPDEPRSRKSWIIYARDGSGRIGLMGGLHPNYYREPSSEADRDSIYITTDRPAYRPGQEVKWKAWARRSSYDPKETFTRFAKHRVTAACAGPRDEEVMLAEKLRTDGYGAVEGSFTLPADASLGRYQLGVGIHDNLLDEEPNTHAVISFLVEEYKKPEFEVKVSAPEKPVMLGDAFEFIVQADYYFGGPVKNAKVSYTVKREAYTDRWMPVGRWDWLYGKGYSTCFCWPPMGGYHPEEVIAQGDAEIGPDGQLKLPVSTALAKELHGDQDHRYSIDVEVTDASRRSIKGEGSVIAARRAFEPYLWLDRGYYRTGESGTANVSARSLDGRSIAGTATLKVIKLGEPEIIAHEAKVELKEEAALALTWPQPGQYRVEASVDDGAGHVLTANQTVTVHGEGIATEGYSFDDLELHLDKAEYAPGDEVEVVVHTQQADSTVALFVRGTNAPPVWLTGKGKVHTHRFKLTALDQPNIFLQAYTVSHAKLHQLAREVIVPPSKHIATVELITDKAAYLPGDQAHATLRVKDQNGEPFIGQVLLTGYDKALEYISGGSNVGDIKDFFWSWKRHRGGRFSDSMERMEVGILREDEFTMIDLAEGSAREMMDGFRMRAGGGLGKSPVALAAPAPAGAPAPAAAEASDGGSAPPQSAVMIRTKLADSAVWISNVSTNAAGEAKLDFPMPENLTTWKLRSWVMGPRTQVGEATVEVITRKDLMVRLQAPRFFTVGDEVTLSGIVHNESDQPLSVTPTLEVSATLALIGEAPSAQTIAAHGEHRFDWRAKAVSAGDAQLTVKAIAASANDAMQQTFPVQERGALLTQSRNLTLRPDQPSGTMEFHIPEERKADTTRLTLRYSPTLAMALVEALPYLSDYPHGCTEQTLNRFVPTVITLGLLKDLKVDLAKVRARLGPEQMMNKAVFDEAEVQKRAKAGLAKLVAMQSEDGGWGWFPGGRESSAHITALVVHGLQVASQSMELDADLIQRGSEWLVQHEKEQLRRLSLPRLERDHLAQPGDTDAFIHAVLVERGAGEQAMRERLYEQRNLLSRQSVALLGLACHAAKDTEKRDMCLRNLQQFVKQDEETQMAWLDLPSDGWWYWWNDALETQATFLKLLCTVEPKGDLAARLAKYLVTNRRHGHYWNSTRDTALIIESLAVFARASGESKPDAKVIVLLDGKPVHESRISRENLFDDHSVVLDSAALSSGDHRVEFQREGKSPLYASGAITFFDQRAEIPARGLEVKVTRKFYKLTEQRTTTTVSGARGQLVDQSGTRYQRTEIATGSEVKSGDLIEVELTVESKNDYEYVLISDAKPAGFEATEVRSGWSYDGLACYSEYRDARVDFYAEHLPRGKHNLRYRVKAEIPGQFTALPSKAEAMYAPELRGNAASWQVGVR